MSAWLLESWAQIPEGLIRGSFRHCFLNDGLRLHVARHETYGLGFRLKLAELSTGATENTEEYETDGESDFSGIDDS